MTRKLIGLADARQIVVEDAGFRAQIATERLGALPGKRGQAKR